MPAGKTEEKKEEVKGYKPKVFIAPFNKRLRLTDPKHPFKTDKNTGEAIYGKAIDFDDNIYLTKDKADEEFCFNHPSYKTLFWLNDEYTGKKPENVDVVVDTLTTQKAH